MIKTSLIVKEKKIVFFNLRKIKELFNTFVANVSSREELRRAILFTMWTSKRLSLYFPIISISSRKLMTHRSIGRGGVILEYTALTCSRAF